MSFAKRFGPLALAATTLAVGCHKPKTEIGASNSEGSVDVVQQKQRADLSKVIENKPEVVQQKQRADLAHKSSGAPEISRKPNPLEFLATELLHRHAQIREKYRKGESGSIDLVVKEGEPIVIREAMTPDQMDGEESSLWNSSTPDLKHSALTLDSLTPFQRELVQEYKRTADQWKKNKIPTEGRHDFFVVQDILDQSEKAKPQSEKQ